MASWASNYARWLDAWRASGYDDYWPGYTYYGVSSLKDLSALLKVTAALGVVSGVLFAIGLIASVYYIFTIEQNINKTRARQMWLMHSFVFVVGILVAFVATIMWTFMWHGFYGAYIVSPIIWLFIDLYNNYVLWSNFVLTP